MYGKLPCKVSHPWREAARSCLNCVLYLSIRGLTRKQYFTCECCLSIRDYVINSQDSRSRYAPANSRFYLTAIDCFFACINFDRLCGMLESPYKKDYSDWLSADRVQSTIMQNAYLQLDENRAKKVQNHSNRFLPVAPVSSRRTHHTNSALK